VVKELLRKAASQRGQCSVTLTSLEHCSRPLAVPLSPLLIFCCVKRRSTASQAPNAFQCAGQPSKLLLLVGDLDPIQYIVPWTHSSVYSPVSISIGLAVFDQQIHRPATPSVAIPRHHHHAMRQANCVKN